MVNKVNAESGTWIAGINAAFEGLTYDSARSLLGTDLLHIADHTDECLDDAVYAGLNDSDVPASFDAREQWPGLVHPIRDQQRCGSCWAFSASEVLSDRVAIATKKSSPVLSPEDMVSCDGGDMGCSGGQLSNAWSYLKSTGIVTDTCFPYTAGGGHAPACETKCVDSESFTRTKVSSAYGIHGVQKLHVLQIWRLLEAFLGALARGWSCCQD